MSGGYTDKACEGIGEVATKVHAGDLVDTDWVYGDIMGVDGILIEASDDMPEGRYMCVSGVGEEPEFIDVDDMEIGHAVLVLEAGHKIARKCWRGGVYVRHALLSDLDSDIEEPTPARPWIVKRGLDGSFVPWVCSPLDLLAKDWHYVS